MKKILHFRTLAAVAGLVAAASPLQQAAADQVINDDQIVIGSECVGQDCVNGENFGFDTIRLKENNLRLHFDDTSNSASFPNVDWRITINDSGNGGGNYFAVEDATASRQIFRVDAGAPANSLRVDSSGDVGIGASNPVVELHVADGDSPTLRLEQDGSSGFTPQTWDLAGNETNFFVRDVTNGSSLPFRIRPNVPTSSIDMFADKVVINDGGGNYDTRIEGDTEPNLLFVDASTDRIGIGTATPAASIHVYNDNDATNATIRIEDTGSGSANKPGFELVSTLIDNGPWRFETNTIGQFQINHVGSLGAELVIEDSGANVGNVTINNDLTVNGTIFGTVSSSSALKKAIEPIDAREVLAKVAEMPVSTWNYDLGSELDRERHLGPMAEDFYAAFGLGRDAKSISLVDYSGVALAAIKGLSQELYERDEAIKDLEVRLARTEALVLSLSGE